MRKWIERQLADVGDLAHEIIIVLDVDDALSDRDVAEIRERADVRVAEDWLTLRRIWEIDGRRHDPSAGQLTIVVRSKEFQRSQNLPFDIERRSTVVLLKLPVPKDLRDLVLDLDDAIEDRAIEIIEDAPADPVAALLQRLWGVSLGHRNLGAGEDIAAVIRLMSDPEVPDAVWNHVRSLLRSPIALALASTPPDSAPLQEAWQEWVRIGSEAPQGEIFERHGPSIMPLFYLGLLSPVVTERDVPAWAVAGVTEPTLKERASALLAEPPFETTPQNVGEWMTLATWWGEVRAVISGGTPDTDDLVAESWRLWEPYDAAFREFLHAEFGRLFSKAQLRPLLVNRINGFLARRLANGDAARILLVVFDGMGMAQWSTLRSDLDLTIVDPGAVVAMAPSLTELSRQAIFAGAPPLMFADSLRSTRREGEMWFRFWENEGVPFAAIGYDNVQGSGSDLVPEFGEKKVFGLVIRAIDQLMHSSKLHGEAQFAASAKDWIRFGYVRRLVDSAAEQGFEIWFTADHGNIEVVPEGRAMEGLNLDTAGTRVYMYESEALRSLSEADGDPWDPPGMPDDGPFCLFPWGRGAFVRDERVTHGGLSFDEMIVPFVQVKP